MGYEKQIATAYKQLQRAQTEGAKEKIREQIRQLQAARLREDGKGWGGEPRK